MIASINNNTYANVKVCNLKNTQGIAVANQFVITLDGSTYFQSHESVVVAIIGNTTFLDRKMWEHSTTTAKYRNIFLEESTPTICKKISTGVYFITDLN